MGRNVSRARQIRTAAVATVASAAAVAGLVGVAGAIGQTSHASTSASGYGYGYNGGGGYGYGYGYSDTPPTSAGPTSSTGSPTPSSSTSASPSASPTASGNPAAGIKITLTISRQFVTLGTRVTLFGTVTRNGVAVANAPVVITEKYSDGKVVPLGLFNTDSSGRYSHIDRPLYIGNITAKVFGVGSNTVPSRVILDYRRTKTSTSGGLLSVATSTHPGFYTGPNRQERVQLLLTDSRGHQKRVLALINAGKRQNAASEGQGINPINFKNIDLGHGTFYIVVKVLGTPVNTGASTKVFKVKL